MITRHVLAGNGAATAIIWDSPVTGKKRRVSYAQLQEDVEVFSAIMKERGVAVGDRVLIYSMATSVYSFGLEVKLTMFAYSADDT